MANPLAVVTGGFIAGSGGGGTPPGAPVLLSVTPGDGSFTASIQAAQPTDVLKVSFASTVDGVWVNDPQTIEGSGDITVIAGPENNSPYYVQAYAVDEDLVSLPSNVRAVVPDDGLLTPEGMIARPKALLFNMLAQSATWLAWTSGRPAADSIRINAINELVDENPKDTFTRIRPYAIIGTADELVNSIVAGGSRNFLRPGGGINLFIESHVPAEYSGDDKLSELMTWFDIRMGKVIEEVSALAGSTGSLNGITFSMVDAPWRPDDKLKSQIGDCMVCMFMVSWGKQ